VIRRLVLTQTTGVTSNSDGPDSDGPDFDGPGFDGLPLRPQHFDHSGHSRSSTCFTQNSICDFGMTSF